MLKYCVNQWEKNKENLRVAFENCDIYSDYEDFARLVIENIFPEWGELQNCHGSIGRWLSRGRCFSYYCRNLL